MKPEVDYLAVIIGAGVGGLGIAIALKRAGIEDLAFETASAEAATVR
ncbi:MAG TPA: hypothetical protein PK331_06425 [Gordonia sp. (in: high G+C Gram-positive bacteria)]|nr:MULTISPECIES: hypothetical protein [unclassified Gordonia (in: high G+C Gram-positive bacteria)]HNP57136.1 hypothetical protein [Gordonia sp. (in: high G+C Gram-positive bacteria)]HRC50544.1 hypothetical protein [Gordonia sp. (in: high G+C Gram-positive bacteria)]